MEGGNRTRGCDVMTAPGALVGDGAHGVNSPLCRDRSIDGIARGRARHDQTARGLDNGSDGTGRAARTGHGEQGTGEGRKKEFRKSQKFMLTNHTSCGKV